MTAKSKTAAAVPKSSTLTLDGKPDESRDALIAKVVAGSHFGAASVITSYGKANLGDISLTDLLRVMKEQAGAVKGGDLSEAEAMLGSQATALNIMFAELARRAAVNMGEYIGAAETYLKLALRAQNQCRATLETLAAIKNPPVVFARQANIAHGPQQVNNAASIARADESGKPPTELLEHQHGERLDTGTTGAAGGSYQTVEAVGALDRSAQRRGQGRFKS
jgi:hypothetical protein